VTPERAQQVADADSERRRADYERQRQWKLANPDKVSAHSRSRYLRKKEEILAKQKAFRANNPDRARLYDRRRDLRKNYGITEGEYDSMLLGQGGVCAICKGAEPSGRRLAVDHCHTTGKVRGLLCSRCNPAIGLFNENVANLASAIDYLHRFFAGNEAHDPEAFRLGVASATERPPI
jgi:hypothetical protein